MQVKNFAFPARRRRWCFYGKLKIKSFDAPVSSGWVAAVWCRLGMQKRQNPLLPPTHSHTWGTRGEKTSGRDETSLAYLRRHRQRPWKTRGLGRRDELFLAASSHCWYTRVSIIFFGFLRLRCGVKFQIGFSRRSFRLYADVVIDDGDSMVEKIVECFFKVNTVLFLVWDFVIEHFYKNYNIFQLNGSPKSHKNMKECNNSIPIIYSILNFMKKKMD